MAMKGLDAILKTSVSGLLGIMNSSLRKLGGGGEAIGEHISNFNNWTKVWFTVTMNEKEILKLPLE
jgi:hypothetical protein